ncbi:hypothetical protein BaRGS_00020884, partial [Batillaria attramentaria]
LETNLTLKKRSTGDGNLNSTSPQDWRPQQGFQLLDRCLQTVKNRPIKDDP